MLLKNKKSIILGILIIVLVLVFSVLLIKIDVLNTEIEALNSDLETQAEYIIQREIVIGDKDVEIAKIQ